MLWGHARVHPLGAAVVLSTAVLGLRAHAQTTELQRVEVSGERTGANATLATAWGGAVPLRTLPVSATVIDAQALGLWQPARLEDLTGLVPGVVVEPLNAGLSTAVKMRGFALTRLHYNGLPDIQRMFARDLATVESVEVLRGPAALLYGVTSPGGVVNYVGKQPAAVARHVLGATVGNDGYARVVLDSTGPLGDAGTATVSPWAYRVVGAAQDGSTSWAELPTRRQQAMAALSWVYAAGGQFTLDVQEQRNQTPFRFGTVITNGGAAGTPAVDADVAFDRLYVLPGGAPAMRRYHSAGLSWSQRLGDSWRLAAQYSQAIVTRDEELLGYWTVKSPTLLSGYYTRYHDSYHQRGLRLNAQTAFATGPLAHSAALGVDQYRQRFHLEGVQNIGGFTLDVANPNFSGVQPATLPTTRRYNDEHVDEQAVWLADRVSLNDATHLTLGVRQQRYTIAADRTGTGRKPVGDAAATTWHAGLSVALSPQWQTYAALSTGMEANRGATHSGDFLPPQTSKQAEAGVNWHWAPDGSMHAAAYRIDLTNLAMTDPTDRTAVISAGQRQVDGLEWAADVGLAPWRVQANAAAMRTRQVVKTSASLGDAFVGVPRYTAGLQLQRSLSDLLGIDSAVWLGLTTVGPRMGDAANTVRVAGYTRIDAGARSAWPGGHAVQVGVRNLANTRYVEAVTAVDDVFQGPLRQVWLTYTITR